MNIIFAGTPVFARVALQRLLDAGALQGLSGVAGGESSGIAFAAWLAEKMDLPLQYVRREDYIRNQTVIEAKLDAVASKLETAQLRVASIGGNHAH